MEIIEKQVEKVKEVPCGYYDGYNHSCCGYGRHGYDYDYNRDRFASKGVGGTGLGLK